MRKSRIVVTPEAKDNKENTPPARPNSPEPGMKAFSRKQQLFVKSQNFKYLDMAYGHPGKVDSAAASPAQGITKSSS